MKKVTTLIFLVFIALGFSEARAQLSSTNLNYEQIGRKMCRLVDSLQPGSYHYFDCKYHVEDLVRERGDLMNYTYKVCSETYVERPWQCYSTLAKELFDEIFDGQMNKYELNEWLQDRFSQNFKNQTFDELRNSGDSADSVFVQKLWKAQDLSVGLGLGVMGTGTVYCSVLSEESSITQKRCFKTLMRELQVKLIN